jgi:type IV secretory pathway TraG/TraD family ATPase VirD4
MRTKLDVTQSGLLYFGLDSLAKPDLTKIVSSSVLQRISAAAGQRTTGQAQGVMRPKFLIVDEANWVDRTIVQNLLSRARSAGIAMVLSTQGPKDWIDKDGNDFARLAQNTNVALIMKQGEPESAQICADFIGTMQYKRFTERVDEGSMSGSGSLMERMENIVDPEEMRGLGVGEAILRVSTPQVRREWLRVTMRDPASHYGQPSAAPQSGSQSQQRPSRDANPLSRRDPGGHTPGLARPPL